MRVLHVRGPAGKGLQTQECMSYLCFQHIVRRSAAFESKCFGTAAIEGTNKLHRLASYTQLHAAAPWLPPPFQPRGAHSGRMPSLFSRHIQLRRVLPLPSLPPQVECDIKEPPALVVGRDCRHYCVKLLARGIKKYPGEAGGREQHRSAGGPGPHMHANQYVRQRSLGEDPPWGHLVSRQHVCASVCCNI